MICSFEESTHIYRVGGMVVPSVTGLIGSTGLIDTSWFTERARWRGSYVHMACQLDDEGKLDEEDMQERHPEFIPYVEAYRLFKRENSFVADIVEKPLFSTLGYGGRPDRVGFMAQRTVIDLKSGAVHRKAVALQNCGYAALANELRGESEVHRRIALRLQVNGRYIMDELPLKHYYRDMRIFQNLVAFHHWKGLPE